MRVALIVSTFLFAPLAFAEDAEEKLKEGHSHQGHAFNEGPRQAGPLFGNTGEVHLPITTTWETGQDYFDQGIGQLHGFWYYEAERSFRNLLAHDPHCLMAYWGLAMANWENEKRARDFIKKGQELRKESQATEREKRYFDSYARFFSEKPRDKKERIKKLISDLEGIIIDFPDDIEAKAFFVCHQWQFNRGGQKDGGFISLDAVLDQIFAKSPMHPAHHYRIHLWDYKKAAKAIDSAARLGSTAPSIAHMWHMPGHIYDKVGRRFDSVWHQEASARLDHFHMMNTFILPDEIHNYGHNNSWLARNLSHLGDTEKAIAVARALIANPRHPTLNNPEKGNTSARYGAQSLVRLLKSLELWEETLAFEKDGLITTSEKNLRLNIETFQLLSRAFYVTGDHERLQGLVPQVTKLRDAKAKEKTEAEEKAREAAIKKHGKDRKIEEGKKDPVDEAVKKAGRKFDGDLKKLNRLLEITASFTAELSGDSKKAAELAPKANDLWEAQRALKLGKKKDELLKMAQNAAKSDKQETAPLANAAFLLAELGKEDEAKAAFEKLRGISAQLNLKARPFARLAPLAKKFGFPSDWRLAHQASDDLLPRPDLASLGELHWTPPMSPSFSLPDQHGTEISLTNYRGKPLVLIFYLGAGCLHCTEQLTAVADRYADFQKAQLPVLAISTDAVGDLKKSQDNYSKGTIPFPIVSDHGKSIFKAYTAHDDFENEPLHGTFVLDGKGRVLWNDISADPFMDLDFLIQEVHRLLELHQ